MHRRNWAIGGVALVATAAGWSLSRHIQAGPALDEAEVSGQEPLGWERSFATPGGSLLELKSFRGRPLLLNFWATWCPPCVKEMPLLDAFFEQHRASGWQVLGLAVDTLAPVQQFLTRHPVRFPIGLAGLLGIDLSRKLGNAKAALPYSAVFDRQGGLFATHLGSVTQSDLADWVARMR